MIKPFPHYQQLDSMDCGPSCLRMIAKYYGRSYSLQNLRERSFITRQGVSMLGISDAAESIGFRTRGVRISLEQLIEDVPLPCILHWNQDHFVVLYGIKKKRAGNIFKISDPAEGKYEMDTVGFEKCWISTKKYRKARYYYGERSSEKKNFKWYPALRRFDAGFLSGRHPQLGGAGG